MATYDGVQVEDEVFESFGSTYGDHTFGGFTYTGTADDDTIYGSTLIVDQPRDSFIFGVPVISYDTSLGTDTLSGGAGNDFVDGNSGADLITGGDGTDTLNGGADNDTVQGNAGNDVISGNAGDDELHGGAGNDTIYGGQGNDNIFGDNGNNFISGDLGNDTITGGPGANTFYVSSSSTGQDIITDFSYAQGDRVELAAGVSYTASQSGSDTIIDFGGGNHITLEGVSMSSLGAGWIFS
jgi:serralysin